MNAKQAADKALNLGKQLQAVIDVGHVLNEIGDLEAATEYASKQSEEAQHELEASRARLDDINTEAQTTQDDLKHTKKLALDVQEDAQNAVNDMIGRARAERDATLQQAADKSNSMIDTAASEVHALKNTKAALLSEIDAVKNNLDSLKTQMRELKERLG